MLCITLSSRRVLFVSFRPRPCRKCQNTRAPCFALRRPLWPTALHHTNSCNHKQWLDRVGCVVARMMCVLDAYKCLYFPASSLLHQQGQGPRQGFPPRILRPPHAPLQQSCFIFWCILVHRRDVQRVCVASCVAFFASPPRKGVRIHAPPPLHVAPVPPDGNATFILLVSRPRSCAPPSHACVHVSVGRPKEGATLDLNLASEG